MCRYSIGAFAKKRKCHFKAMQTSRFVFLVIVLGLAGAQLLIERFGSESDLIESAVIDCFLNIKSYFIRFIYKAICFVECIHVAVHAMNLIILGLLFMPMQDNNHRINNAPTGSLKRNFPLFQDRPMLRTERVIGKLHFQ